MKKYFLKLKKQVEAYEKSKHSSADPVYYSTTSTATWSYVNQAAADQPVEINPALMAALNAQIVGLQQQQAAMQQDVEEHALIAVNPAAEQNG
jgi:hypothetical protein